MGQRLNIEIASQGKTLANAYYHWSGYTSSALELAERIVHDYFGTFGLYRVYHHKDISDMEIAIRLLTMTGAGFPPDEINRIEASDIYNEYLDLIVKSLDRNAGLIAITEKGIEQTRRWEEARVTIDINTMMVDFGALSRWTEAEAKQYGVEELAEKCTTIHTDIFTQPFSAYESGTIREIIKRNPDGVKLDDTYIFWIE